jgi:ParB/RepB/Spo0J family partition protein
MKANNHHKRKPEKRTHRAALVRPVEERGLNAFAPILADAPDAAATGQPVKVEIDLIDVPADVAQRPLDLAKVESYAATIKQGGLLQPVTLRPKEDGRFELVFGRHRLEAHKLAGYATVPALIRADMDPVAAAIARGVENAQRRRYPPYEEALDYDAMQKAGLSSDDVARVCNVPAKHVVTRLRLLALPMDVGMRIGEPGFPLSHAEILLDLVPYPDAFALALKAVGKVDYDGRALTSHGFGEAVAHELRKKRLVKDLGTWQTKELQQRHPEIKKPIGKLPKVRLGGTTYTVDPKSYRKIVWPAQEKEREARKKAAAREAHKGPPKDSREAWMEQERQRNFLRAFFRHEHGQRIEKAAKASLGFDDRLLGLLATDAIHTVAEIGRDDRCARLLAAAIGTSTADLAKVLDAEGEKGAVARQKFVERLLAHGDRLVLARFLTVATILRLESRSGYDWPWTSEDWLGVTVKDVHARAQKAYKAWAKAGAKDPLPGQEAEDEEAGEPAPAVTATVPAEPEAAAAG